MESIYRRPAKDGDEVDAFADHRHLIWRAGQRKAAKARCSRRTRRTTRTELRGMR
jgi:hypothetical protein